ncbi:MAG TPA: diacylglycerol kinase family protein, partial [Saprospiraceae bacterium]|nr:diacylglycerol kinase family protein [Saprospiraceae bacterium]
KAFFQSEPNARIHLIIAILVIIAGFYFQLSKYEWGIILLTIAMVITAEAINTALEKLTDLASPDIHPLAKKVKDIAAGAVLISVIFAVIIGGFIFWGHLFGSS